MIQLSRENWWTECGQYEYGTHLRAAVSAFLNSAIAPRIMRYQFDDLINKHGKTINLDGQTLTCTFVPFTNVPDGSDGRLTLMSL